MRADVTFATVEKDGVTVTEVRLHPPGKSPVLVACASGSGQYRIFEHADVTFDVVGFLRRRMQSALDQELAALDSPQRRKALARMNTSSFRKGLR